jgi:O-antigen/teichoic acid export membrane protein
LFNSSVWFVGFSSLVATIFTIVANIYFTKKLTPELKINFKQFKLEYIIEMVKNGVWNTVNKLSGILQNGLDLLISNIFVSSVAMGIIALPRTITSIIFSLFGSIASIFNPNIMQAYANDDYESIKKQLNFAIKFTGTFSNVCIAIFIALGIEFYQLWVPTQNANFLYLLTILSLLSLAVGIPVEPVYAVHTSTNKIKKPAIMTLILSVITIIVVLLGIYLVDNENMKIIIISATSSIISLYRLLIYIPIYTAKILDEKKSYLYPVLFKCYISLLVCILINFTVKSILPLTNWVLFFASCFVLAVFNLLINIFMNFNGAEKDQFKEFFKKQFRLK